MSATRGNARSIGYRSAVFSFGCLSSFGLGHVFVDVVAASESPAKVVGHYASKTASQSRVRFVHECLSPLNPALANMQADADRWNRKFASETEDERADERESEPLRLSILETQPISRPTIAVRPPRPLAESNERPKSILDSTSDRPMETSIAPRTTRTSVRQDAIVHEAQEKNAIHQEPAAGGFGPTITPLDRSSRGRSTKTWNRVEIQIVPDRTVSALSSERTVISEIGPASGEMTWPKSGVQQSVAHIEEDTTSDTALPASNIDSEPDLPAQQILEIRKRLQSAASLNPGDVLVPQSVDPPTTPAKDLRTSINEPRSTFKLRKRERSNVDPTHKEAVAEKSAEVRQPVIGRTSFIKWQPVNDAAASATVNGSSRGQSENLQPDLRQSLAVKSNSTPPPEPAKEVDRATEADLNRATPTRYVRSPATVEDRGDSIDVPQATAANHPREEPTTEPTESQFHDALLDHPDAPSDPVNLSPMKDSSRTLNEPWDTSISSPLPPGESNRDGHEFDHPSDLFKRNWKPRNERSNSSSPSAGPMEPRQSISKDDAANESANDELQTKSGRTTMPENDAGPASQPVGLSKPSTSGMLTLVTIASIFAGLWFVRSLVRAIQS